MGIAERALEWLDPRLAGLPEDLAAAVRDSVRRASEGEASSVPRLLADAAIRELDRVLELPQSRETAIRLLAADAILTYAFRAAADLGEDVKGLADSVGVRGRIGRRLAALGTPAPEEP